MEKTQEQIRFENMYYKSMGGFWRHYAPTTMGNVIHWLHTYGTLHFAETVQIGEGQITLYSKPILKWKDNPACPDVPYFYDLEDPKYDFILQNQEIYLDGLKKFPTLVADIDKKYAEAREWLNGAKASNNN
jgi:hypothetical protein